MVLPTNFGIVYQPLSLIDEGLKKGNNEKVFYMYSQRLPSRSLLLLVMPNSTTLMKIYTCMALHLWNNVMGMFHLMKRLVVPRNRWLILPSKIWFFLFCRSGNYMIKHVPCNENKLMEKTERSAMKEKLGKTSKQLFLIRNILIKHL
jgi:hypothetical protein